MALEGRIKEFGVADILQLIAQQQKTGILMIENKHEKAEVYFVDGQIIETQRFQQSDRNPLGEILIRAGLISFHDLKSALAKQKKTCEHLGHILLREGFATKEQLEKTILIQAYETFYDILQWYDGTYRFISHNISIDNSLSSIPALEVILLDVLRMIDEWPGVKQVITSFNMVFARGEKKTDGKLDSDELLVYDLVNGSNTVQDIVDKSLLGRFSACKVLAGLFQNQYIKLTPAKAKKRRPGGVTTFQKAVGVASYAGLFSILSLLFLLAAKHPGSVIPLPNQKTWAQSHIKQYLRLGTMQKLAKALEIFRLKNGRYPEKTAELVSSGILRDGDLKAFTNETITYSKKGDFYLISF